MTSWRRLALFGLGLGLAGTGLVVSTHSAMGVPPAPQGLAALAVVAAWAAALVALGPAS